MRWLLLLTLSCRLFAVSFDDVIPSTPEEILSLTTDLLVDGFVSVVSGQISISETDLRVRSAEDVILKRTYIPPRILGRYADKDKEDRFALGEELAQLQVKGWVVHPHLLVGYNRNSRYFQICDPQGFVLEFHIQGTKGILKTASYGCSNLRGDTPSSSADIRNIELVIEGDCVQVTWPDGLIRHYARAYRGIYRLEKEILSNGKLSIIKPHILFIPRMCISLLQFKQGLLKEIEVKRILNLTGIFFLNLAIWKEQRGQIPVLLNLAHVKR